MSYKCLECKDKGVYEGLNVVEPCKSCSGSTSQEYYIETTRGTIKSLDFEIEKDFTMYDDMSSSTRNYHRKGEIRESRNLYEDYH